MRFSEFLNESSAARENSARNALRRKAIDGLDKANGNESKERAFGRSIYKEIHKKYLYNEYFLDSVSDTISEVFIKANAWAALEGARDYYKEIGNDSKVKLYQIHIDDIDKKSTTNTGTGDVIKNIIASIKKGNKFNYAQEYYSEKDDYNFRFPNTDPTTISVKESVKVAAANLYFQHKIKYFKKIDTVSSKASLIISISDRNAGEIQHIIYDDNGTTKITSFGARSLVTDALEGTFNKRTITEI